VTRLVDLASILRTKNAGPLTLTIDILFDDKNTYNRVVQSGAINQQRIGEIYDVNADDVLIVEYGIVNAIKVAFPRKCVSGNIPDNLDWNCLSKGSDETTFLTQFVFKHEHRSNDAGLSETSRAKTAMVTINTEIYKKKYI